MNLLRRLWQVMSPDEARALFKWRYLDNPRSETPCVFVARDGHEVVGLRCYVIQRFALGREIFPVACPADAIVHPDYRRRGIVSRLTLLSLEQLAAEGIGLVLNLSANRASTAAAKKLGWQEFGATRYMYCVGPLPHLRKSLGLLRRPCGSTLEISARVDGEPPRCRYPRIGDDRLACVHDRAFYAWRYRQPSVRFHRVSAQDGKLNGYLILREASARMFHVMEYGCDAPHMLPEMVRGFVEARGGRCLLRLQTSTGDEAEAALFREAGFFYEPRSLIALLGKHRSGPLVRTTELDGQRSGRLPSLDLTDARRWYLRPADVH